MNSIKHDKLNWKTLTAAGSLVIVGLVGVYFSKVDWVISIFASILAC